MWRYLLLAAIFLSGPQTNDRVYRGPDCLGPFCVGRDLPLRMVLKQLGQPATKGQPFCYQSQDGQTFLWLTGMADGSGRVGDVLVSDFPNCLHRIKHVTAEDVRAWKTKDGIGLGSSREDVLRTYGKPTWEDKIVGDVYRHVFPGDRFAGARSPQIGDTRLFYRGAQGDLRVAQFGIRKGKVCWIRLLENE
jgi:hypothetical protein